MLNLQTKTNQLMSDMTNASSPKNKKRRDRFSSRFWSLISCLLITVYGVTYAADQTPLDNDGENLAQSFQEELDTWMLRAYEGDRDAQFKVGVLFTNDQFNEPDFEQAVYWYKQAARQGHTLAQYNLGHQYLNGVGVQQSTETAMQWWLKAAKLGHALAQFNIGRAYYLGIGLPEDSEQAKYWFQQAANNKEPKSIEILAQLGWDDATPIESVVSPIELSSTDTSTKEEVAEPVINSDVVQESTTASRQEPKTEIAKTSDTSSALPTETIITSKPIEPVNIEPINSSIANTNKADNIPQNTTARALPIEPKPIEPKPTEPKPIEPKLTNAKPIEPAPTDTESPIALYTDPGVRSVLIAIAKDSRQLEVIKESNEWSIVRHRQGFPVWIHGNFIKVVGNKGTITGDAVNARSIPMIIRGSIIEQVNKGEAVTVLNQVREWYRVISPSRFEAWVRTPDFKKALAKKPTNSTPPSSSGWSINKSNEESKTNTSKAANKPQQSSAQIATATPINVSNKIKSSNQWLFSQPSGNYTLQLASFDTQEKVADFLNNTNLKNDTNLHQFTSHSKQISWVYFLYGTFSDKETAVEMKNNLDAKQSWVRNIGRLQQNRCISWKKQLPTPKELNTYCTP